MVVECPNCGESFDHVGQHWSMSSSCGEPKFTERQKKIITGLLMGDANVTESENRKPYLQIMMNNREFVEWVSDELGVFATEIAEVEGTGFSEGEEYYQLRSRRVSELDEFASWYSKSGKLFPDEVDLCPLILKVWYCCDGDKSVDSRWNTKEYARISAHNEVDNKNKINSYFEELEFAPNWNDGGRFTFGREGSHKFWSYIGDPLPGFGYKWPDEESP